MSKEICISTTPHETRLAIIEDDQLTEIYYERENEYTLAGSIYKGRVTRVLPGMQSAFVDVGLERDAFLYVTDFLEEQEDSADFEQVKQGNGGRSGRGDRPEGRGDRPEARGEGRGDGGERRRDGRDGRPEAARQPQESGEAQESRAPREAREPREARAARNPVAAEPPIVTREVEGAPADQEEFAQGTRRWRGRRRRGRGSRAREANEGQAAQPQAATYDAAHQPAIEEQADEAEDFPLPGRHSIDASEAEPQRSAQGAQTAPQGDSRRRDVRPQTRTEPALFLPGESLQKYGHETQESSATSESVAPETGRSPSSAPAVTARPSTLVEHPIAWDGVSVALPGESLSRHRDRSASEPRSAQAQGSPSSVIDESVRGSASAEVAPPAASTSTDPEMGERWGAGDEYPLAEQPAAEPYRQTVSGVSVAGAVASDTSAIDYAFPPAHPEATAEDQLRAQHEGTAARASAASTHPYVNETLASDQHSDRHAAGVDEPAPLVLEEVDESAGFPEHLESRREEPAEYDPQHASASFRVDPSSPSEFRFTPEVEEDAPASEHEPSSESRDEHAGVRAPEHQVSGQRETAEQHAWSGEATESPASETAARETAASEFHHQPKIHHDRPHEDAVHQDVEIATGREIGSEPGQTSEAVTEASPSARESQPLEHIHAFTPGDGPLEEELIDEDEYDFSPVYGAEDEHDFEDLEEETLDSQAPGTEIGEMIREAHIDRQVNVEAAEEEQEFDEEGQDSTDEPMDESADESEDELDEEPADAVAAGALPVPQRRDGRGADRQRGRGRHGRSGRAGGGRRQSAQTTDLPIISELLKQGQEILVQIAKEPIAKKGARITSHIALPGRFLVFMPTVNHVGVSRKIYSDEERQRLKRILISEKGQNSGGFIVRTAADGASEEELRADLRFLISLWNEIKQRSDAGKAPALIYHDLNLVERILRDQVSDNFSTIWVDSETEYERIVRFLNRFQPSLVRRVKLYTKETPLFEQFGIQDEISKALKSKVWLKSGGSIVINQTEALVAIDINTGKYVGKTARLEDTILKTNLDAIPEIVRQIRLRDLGGIIVIDFIDMDERKNRHKVMQALEEALKADRAPSKVLQFNDFGLVAITRKRVKQSLERTLSVQCEICAGTGMVKSPTTVCNEIYVEMRKMQKHLERRDVLLRVHPEVVKTLKGNGARWLTELEEMTGRTIIVKSDPTLHPEQFDIH